MILYRGENIKNGNPEKVESLKRLLRYGFPSEFINGGNPYRIQERGFLKTALDHVGADNNLGGRRVLKNFISFSSNKEIAKKFATSYAGGYSQNELPDDHLYCDDKTDAHIINSLEGGIWDHTDHLIIQLNIDGAVNAYPGHDYLKVLAYGATNKLLLVDCEKYLGRELARYRQLQMPVDQINEIEDSYSLSCKDKEWLALSLDTIEGGSYSALLAHGPFQVKHYVTLDFYGN